MLKIISSFIDLIFPPRQTEVIVRKLTKETVTQFYSPGLFKNFFYLTSYQSPAIQALIKENKFHHNRTAALLLGHVLEKWLNQKNDKILIIPIPLSVRRMRERGYNQVMEVLQALPTNPNWHIDALILGRKLHTTPQTSLSRAERLRNMSDVFKVSGNIKETVTLVVLVDDVVTTGTTLSAAHAALAQHITSGAQIVCVALAH